MVGPSYSKSTKTVGKQYSRADYIKEFGGSKRMGNRRAHLLDVQKQKVSENTRNGVNSFTTSPGIGNKSTFAKNR